MAKLKMKRIELIAPLTDSKQIIELLQRRGVVELCENSSEELEQMNVAAVMGEFEKFRSTVDQALNILDKYAPEKASLTDVFGGRDEIEKHEFGRKAADLEKIMNAAGEIIKNHKTITEAQAEIIQLGIRSDLLEPWTTLDVPTNFKGTSKTNAYIPKAAASKLFRISRNRPICLYCAARMSRRRLKIACAGSHSYLFRNRRRLLRRK